MIRVSDQVGAEHAAFAGHFPGNPMPAHAAVRFRVRRGGTLIASGTLRLAA